MRAGDTATAEFSGEPARPKRGTTVFATALLTAVLLAGLGCLALPGLSRSIGDEPDFSRVPGRLGKWTDSSVTMNPYDFQRVKDTLTFNTARDITYTAASGERATAWLIYWKSAMVVKDYHSPDVCNSKHGDVVTIRETHEIVTPKGRRIPLTYREVANNGHNKLVVYWTQEGRRIWTDADEARCASFVFPFAWMSDRLTRQRNADEGDDRLVVYIAMPLFKNRSVAAQGAVLQDLAGRLADELYEVCPWADPK